MYMIDTAKEQHTPKIDDALIKPRRIVATTRAGQFCVDAQEMIINDTFVEDISKSNRANAELDALLEWNETEIDFDDFLHIDADDKSVSYRSTRHTSPSTTEQFQEFMSARKSSIPLLTERAVRSYVHHPSTKPGAQGITKLIMHTLRSYPYMMMRHSNLPPFIHQCLVGPLVDANNMEPLTNCISLVHMISSGVRGSRKLFWKNVRMECERLFTDVLISDDISLDKSYLTAFLAFKFEPMGITRFYASSVHVYSHPA